MVKQLVMVFLICFVFSSVAFASATLISGQNQNVTFNSSPEGAIVSIDGVKTCQTPCTVSLSKTSSEQMIKVEKKGYKTMTVPMTTEYNPVALLSIFWDLSTTDLISGAAFSYEPNSYFIELPVED